MGIRRIIGALLGRGRPAAETYPGHPPLPPAPSPAAAGVSPSAAAAALVPAKPQPLGFLRARFIFFLSPSSWCFCFFFFFFKFLFKFVFFLPHNNFQRSKWKELKTQRFLVTPPPPPGFAAPPRLGSPFQSPPPPLQRRGKENFLCHREPEFETRNKARLFSPLFLRGEKEEGGSRGARTQLPGVCFFKSLVLGFVF